MNYGLYLSASGVLTNMYRQDVFANNLANARTVGFKPDVPAVRQRDPESIEDRIGFGVRHDLLDRLGGGVFAGPQSVKLKDGPMIETGGSFDVALERRNHFFVVGVDDPRSGERLIRLTRDGRFTRDARGELVTATGGHVVLDPEDKPIALDATAPVKIDGRGRIHQNGDVVAAIQVAQVDEVERLIKDARSQFRFDGDADLRDPVEDPVVRSGYVEGSAVDPIRALMDLVGATKAVSSNGNLIRYHDLLMDRAVNVLGHVAA